MNLKDAHPQTNSEVKPPPSKGQQVIAWGVHLYTSLGLPLALASMIALVDGDATLFFLLNLSAVLIDATDGFLARTLKVKEVLPSFNGAKLDELIDPKLFIGRAPEQTREFLDEYIMPILNKNNKIITENIIDDIEI